MGNSDHSFPRTAKPATSLTAAAPLWRAFVRDLTRGDRVARFARPSGVVDARIDAWSGGRPGPWTRATTTEWFIAGTAPGGRREIDPAGLLYTQSCGGWRVDPLGAELGPRSWDDDVADWVQRARRGPGVTGRLRLPDGRTSGARGRGVAGSSEPAHRLAPNRDATATRTRTSRRTAMMAVGTGTAVGTADPNRPRRRRSRQRKAAHGPAAGPRRTRARGPAGLSCRGRCPGS